MKEDAFIIKQTKNKYSNFLGYNATRDKSFLLAKVHLSSKDNLIESFSKEMNSIKEKIILNIFNILILLLRAFSCLREKERLSYFIINISLDIFVIAIFICIFLIIKNLKILIFVNYIFFVFVIFLQGLLLLVKHIFYDNQEGFEISRDFYLTLIFSLLTIAFGFEYDVISYLFIFGINFVVAILICALKYNPLEDRYIEIIFTALLFVICYFLKKENSLNLKKMYVL